MNFSGLAISRPFATAVGFLVAVLLGLYALGRLPIDLMPDITFPTLSISTTYDGVGPEEIETLVSRPIEETVSAVQGLEEITSSSVEGRSQVRLSFRWGTDLDAAAEDLRGRLDRVRSRLPDDASPPILLRFDLAAFPVVFLAVRGDLAPVDLKELAEDQVKARIERVPGVAAVDVSGGVNREIRVEVDRQKVTAVGLTLDQVQAALSRENIDAPAGEVQDGKRSVGLRVRGTFGNLEQIADTPIAQRFGRPILVRDVAVVVDTYQDVRSLVTIDGVPSLMLRVNKQTGANTVQVAEGVIREVEALNRDLRGAHVVVTNDTSRFIRRSIHHLTNDLYAGSVLAIGVILFFLRNIRATLIVATAIPVSVIATFVPLYFQGFSLNTMSLGGLALGVGRLVDDSIVVIENIFRHRAMGKSPAQAALDGTRQVSLAIVASTVTTIAVFVPLVFLAGMSGVLFGQLSFVVAFALACSLVVAQGLIPMLASRFLGSGDLPRGPARHMYGAVGGFHDALGGLYSRTLRWALKHAMIVVGICLILVLGSVALLPRVGTEFMPAADEGEVRINGEMAPGTPLDVLSRQFGALERIVLREVPETQTIIADIGGGSGYRPAGSNSGSLRVLLTDRGERVRSSEEIALALRRRLEGVPGVRARVNASGGMILNRLVGGAGGGRLGVQVRGHDIETATRLAGEVRSAMALTPGIADVRIGREGGVPEAVIEVDRARAAAMGVSVTQIASALEAGVLGKRATALRERGDEIPVVVRLRTTDRQTVAAALDLPVTAASGKQIPLRDVVRVSAGEGPVRIDRDNQERLISVSGEPEGKDLGGIVAALRTRLAAITVPPDFAIVISGDFEEQQKAFRELATALGLALLLVFLIMVAQFESVRDPFAILLSVPACITGVVAALLLTGTTLNVQSFIGIIVLTGVAVSNGIVMVDFINQLRRKEGLPLGEAIESGAAARLRPVLMTTLATVLALVPMALGLGEGGELQAPMARVLVGGLASSTLITLFLVPIVYRALHRRDAEPPAETPGKTPGETSAETPAIEPELDRRSFSRAPGTAGVPPA